VLNLNSNKLNNKKQWSLEFDLWQ